MISSLQKYCSDWKKWAKTANRSLEGWQSDYQKWELLMNAAKRAMTNPDISGDELRLLEFCWAISEETEDLADYAKDNIDQCWEILSKLLESEDKDVRWQVYATLSVAGHKAEDILKKGLNDVDPYCRRRALISLAYVVPNDAKEIAEKFIYDDDPYIRQAAIEMVLASNAGDLRQKAKHILVKDKVRHVADAAAKKL